MKTATAKATRHVIEPNVPASDNSSGGGSGAPPNAVTANGIFVTANGNYVTAT